MDSGPDNGKDRGGSEETEAQLPMIPVTVVKTVGKSAVVQYTNRGTSIRVLVPAEDVDNGKCSEETLAAGIPQSVEWAKFFKSTITPKLLEKELFRANIWTYEDLLASFPRAQKILMRTFNQDLLKMSSEVKDHV